MQHARKLLLAALLGGSLLTCHTAQAQQTIGANVAPGSTLDVKGSLSGNYLQVTSTAYTMLATDYNVVYYGNGSGTITLPSANQNTISGGAANYKGRVYYIKNTTLTRSLTVMTASSAESIDGNLTVSVSPGQSVQLVSTGLAAGSASSPTATWELMSFNYATTAGPTLGAALYLKATTNTQTSASTIVPVNLNTVVYNSGDYSYNTSTNIITVNRAGTYIATLQVSFTNIQAGDQLLGGITAVSTGRWIGRGSHFAAAATSGTIGELLTIAVPVALSAGQQVRFAVAPSSAALVLANEMGSTGTGVVTTALLQKVSEN